VFSARTSWDRHRKFAGRATAQARAEGGPLCDLTGIEPDARVDRRPSSPVAELVPARAIYQPAPFGHAEARQAVAGYYADRGVGVDPDRVVLSASTSEAYAWLFGLLADPDDTILVPDRVIRCSAAGRAPASAARAYRLAREADFESTSATCAARSTRVPEPSSCSPQ